jgi:type IV pilus assembly protein PilA
MIVVAIIAILAAIALPQYQNYVARSQATAGLADITPGKTAYEEMVNNGMTATNFTVDAVGLQTSTERCAVTLTQPGTDGAAAAALKCALKGNPKVATKTIQWDRASNGSWTCHSTLEDKFRPKGCVNP